MTSAIGRNNLKKGLTPLDKNKQQEKHRYLTGFTLIEIMVGIAILSVGLILILQGFTHSLNILRISQNNLEASLLAEEKMVELQIDVKQNKATPSKDLGAGLESGNIEFKWEIRLTSDEEYEDLNKVFATIIWREGRRRGTLPLVTYLRIPKEEK